MLANFPAMPTLPTADLARARGFYEGLGFHVVQEGEEGLMFGAGSSVFLVFPTPYAGTNKATAMAFSVGADEFTAEVEALHAHGASFMTFDAPRGTWEGDVLKDADGLSAWFSDPDGNVIALSTMPPVSG